MKIYVSDANNNKRLQSEALLYKVGHCVTPKYYRKKQIVNWFLDNGAYKAFTSNTPLNEGLFYDVIERCITDNNIPDFIVIPDIVSGGIKSLEYSITHIPTLECYDIPLYLALQDGITSSDVASVLYHHNVISGLFIGGSKEWKMNTMGFWKKTFNLPVHVGRIGTIKDYKKCFFSRIDSVDGSNPSRNNKMYIINDFRKFVSSL